MKSLKQKEEWPFMICQRMGISPIVTIGLGLYSVSFRSRVPAPPQRMTTFSGVIFMLLLVARCAERPYSIPASFGYAFSIASAPELGVLP